MRDADRWRAVQARDARFDRTFVYAVRSTGVYCRPSCPSRRPARRQVQFLTGAEEATRRGFRPCRRCRPETGAADPVVERVGRACRYLEDHPEPAPTLRALGAHVGLSPHHLQRTFKRLLGVTPRQYLDERRMRSVREHLKGGRNVTDALYEAGFGSSSRLYERAPSRLGMTPATYRRGGDGAMIRYTIGRCPLGLLLVAATQRGVCRVSLGDDARALASELGREYPGARIARDDAALGRWLGAVLERLEGRQPHVDLPLDIRATAFQRRVWEMLRAIPRGATRTYGEIARALGRPRAARAVGAACAANPVALVIPCHRAVRGDGGLGGYRWGLERKQALLSREDGRRR